ncbi:diguanylate cyclase [Vibrio sp. H11]|uniref:sensor domain-containing diguanylate cyclase n=1 Tax=Vibrio sp. H11 TaxID=2565928 RepID=UPI0010A5E035|nr:diguanylate cyclase [Vibrio sp. H11]
MPSTFTKYIGQFVLVLFIIGFVPALYFAQEFTKLEGQALALEEQKQRVKLDFSKRELVSSLNEAYKTFTTLTNNSLFHRAVSNPNEFNIEAVQDFWLLVARTLGGYSSLSFIDRTGQETIRVDYIRGMAVAITDTGLINRSKYDEFLTAQHLKSGQIVVVGGNQFHALTATSKQPVLHFVTPIDSNGERAGYLVAEVSLEYIYQQMLGTDDPSAGLPSLLNSRGDVLMTLDNHQNIEVFPATNLALTMPELWQHIESSQQGTLFTKDQWFSFVTISQSQTLANVQPLILLESFDVQALQPLIRSSKNRLLWQMYAMFFVITLIALGCICWNRNHHKNSIESKLARAAMNGMSAVLITDKNNRIIKVNSEFTNQSGYSFDEVKGKQPSIFASGKHNQEFYLNMWKSLQEDGSWEGEVVNRHRDGHEITEILRIQTILDDDGIIQFYVASFVDISQRKELENLLRDQSEKDGLTGIWNRRKFDQEFSSECMRVKRYPEQEHSCLAIVDIDHFKRINDRFGHARGDEILRNVAVCLRTELRESDFISRIGGEEFAIIMPHTSLEEADKVLNRLRVAIFDQYKGELSISSGITDVTESTGDVYQRADLALYESKASGRNLVSVLTSTEMVHFA